VTVDGWFTITTMKKGGYEKEYAGAVEAVSSTGGQLMPPVMGAAAFVMADYIGVPYATICVAAALPAVMYYCILALNIYLYASRKGLYGAPKEEIPRIRDVLRKHGHLFLPVLALIMGLVLDYSPTVAALAALMVLLVVSFFKPETRLTWSKVYEALQSAGMTGVQVGVAAAAAGIILGIFMLTGLGTKIASLLIMISGRSVFFLLVICMLTSIIFGMGMPTTPCYILLATLIGPALTEMGIPKILAHLFIFYFGMLSMITPPVAMAAYAAAAIAKASFYRTGFVAWRLALPVFIIPYFFVYYPGFALMGSWDSILSATFWASVGLVACTVGLNGYFRGELRIWERLVLTLGGLGVIHKSVITDIIGIIILALFFVLKFRKPYVRTAQRVVIPEEGL
jgi:TRAP transporter 4TM/12TM fusion protein